MNNQLKGLFYIMIPIIAIGVSYVNTKVLLELMGSASLGLIRMISVVLIITLTSLIFGFFNKDLRINIVPLKMHKYFIFLGGIGTALYIYLQNLGITLISPTIVSVLIATIPIARVLAEFIVDKRRIRKYELFLIFLSLLGLILIIGNPVNLFKSGEFRGYLYIMGAIFASVACFFIVKGQQSHKHNNITLSFYNSLYATVFFLLFVILTDEKKPDISSLMHSKYIIHMLFLVIFASFLATIYHIKAIKAAGMFMPSILMTFIPIITLFASYIFLGDSLTFIQILGGILILTPTAIFNFR